MLGDISTRGFQGYANAKQLLIRANIEPLKREDPTFQGLAAWHLASSTACWRHSAGKRNDYDWIPAEQLGSDIGASLDDGYHQGEVLTLTGDSYRTRQRRELLAKENRTANN